MEQILKKSAGEDKQFPLIEVMVALATIGILVTIALQKFLAG
jgi:prepilin-type N-terminal cleavage/methylation domain-containing protein